MLFWFCDMCQLLNSLHLSSERNLKTILNTIFNTDFFHVNRVPVLYLCHFELSSALKGCKNTSYSPNLHWTYSNCGCCWRPRLLSFSLYFTIHFMTTVAFNHFRGLLSLPPTSLLYMADDIFRYQVLSIDVSMLRSLKRSEEWCHFWKLSPKGNKIVQQHCIAAALYVMCGLGKGFA